MVGERVDGAVPVPPDSGPPGAQSAARAAALFAAAFFAWSLLPVPASALHGGSRGAVLFASSTACTIASFVVIALTRRVRFSPLVHVALVAASTALVFGLTRGAVQQPLLVCVKSLAMLAIAVTAGAAVGCAIQLERQVFAISCVLAATDLWSVSSGVSRVLTESDLLGYFLVAFPLAGSTEVKGFLGTADFLFVTMYLTIADRFGLSPSKMLLILLGSFVASSAASLGLGHPVPVLPFMVVVIHAAEWNRLRPTREGIRLAVAGLVFLAVAGGLFAHARRHRGPASSRVRDPAAAHARNG